MSNTDSSDGDNWIFDSLVNFLHGNIWKMPVLGFVEEKSVVFDPDSYANLSDEKEEEFRKIHESYKSLVDFMLSSFMDDLQVTPEQVEEACQQREKQSCVADSHITKVALEQLQAAEDFNIFRRIMTRKNIDLQLQSLELLVSKYGVLSPSLRSEGCDPGDTGEDDFLQVVIRYCGESGLLDDDANNGTHNTTITPAISCTLHHKSTSSGVANKADEISSSSKAMIGNDKSCIQSKSGSQKKAQSYMQPDKEISSITNVLQSPAQLEKSKQRNSIVHSTVIWQNDFSQLIQQDLADGGLETATADMGIESIQPARLHEPGIPVQPPPSRALPGKQGLQEINKGRKKESKKSVKFDETTVAEIATVAPEQHRMLTSVRQALDVDSVNDLETGTLNLDMTGSDEDINKRRAYLRAQRDKLVALKKRERERQLETAAGQQSRPKSARAAQMAMRSSPSATGEKSLAARRALAAVLKQELLDK